MSPAEPLTLAVPYYSGFALFEQTLRSLAAQRYAHCHVLIVDDSVSGLSVREREAIEGAVRVPLRVLRNSANLGMAKSWNRCLDEADTDLVTIVHADDLLAPDYASTVVGLGTEVPAVFTGAQIIGTDGLPAFSVPDLYKRTLVPAHDSVLRVEGERGLASLLRGNYIFCPSITYRRSRMKLRFDPRWRFVVDLDLTTRLLLAGESLVGVPRQPLYRYRRHADNATQQLTAELTRFREESAFYLEMGALAEQRGWHEAARIARRQRVIQLNLGFCIARDLLTFDFRGGARKLGLFRDLFVQRRVP